MAEGEGLAGPGPRQTSSAPRCSSSWTRTTNSSPAPHSSATPAGSTTRPARAPRSPVKTLTTLHQERATGDDDARTRRSDPSQPVTCGGCLLAASCPSLDVLLVAASTRQDWDEAAAAVTTPLDGRELREARCPHRHLTDPPGSGWRRRTTTQQPSSGSTATVRRHGGGKAAPSVTAAGRTGCGCCPPSRTTSAGSCGRARSTPRRPCPPRCRARTWSGSSTGRAVGAPTVPSRPGGTRVDAGPGGSVTLPRRGTGGRRAAWCAVCAGSRGCRGVRRASREARCEPASPRAAVAASNSVRTHRRPT